MRIQVVRSLEPIVMQEIVSLQHRIAWKSPLSQIRSLRRDFPARQAPARLRVAQPMELPRRNEPKQCFSAAIAARWTP
jgi:hypothetical protein